MKHILNIPTSQIDIERIFAIAGILISHDKCCLQIDNLGKSIFISKN